MLKAIIIFLCINSIWLIAQNNNGNSDTLSLKVKSINVTASKLESHPAAAFTSLKLITAGDIEKIGGGELSDVLASSPGVFIKNLGGAGGLKTISIRGTEPSQTLLLLDGMRLSSTQSGFSDLSVLPMSIIEEIELVRGGASSMYGGNALGGVVNLRTKSIVGNKIGGALSFGQYGDYKGSANFLTGNEKSSVFGNIEYNYSEGVYPIIVNQFGRNETVSRKNADFKNLSGFIAFNYNYEKWDFGVKTLFRNTERGVPGAALQGRIESSKSRLNEEEAIVIVSSQKKISSLTKLYINGMMRVLDTRYTDSDALGLRQLGVDYLFVGRDAQINSKLSWILGDIIGETSAEAIYSDLRGKMLQLDAGGNVDRFAASIAQRLDYEMTLNPELRLGMNAAVRIENFSDIGAAASPSAGLLLSYLDGIVSVRGNWSYNFRAPSFNEMYYLNYGSSDLKPERSHSVNLGFKIFPFDNISFEAVGFVINTNDQILSVPTSPASWRAENVENVMTRGLEISAAAKFFDDILSFRLSYTRQMATDESKTSMTYKKQLVYVPQELMSSGISAHISDFLIGLNLDYSGFRFSLPDNSYNSMLPSYFISDAFIIYKPNFADGLEIRAEISNIFDENAASIRNYPLPGRQFIMGLKFNFKNLMGESNEK